MTALTGVLAGCSSTPSSQQNPASSEKRRSSSEERPSGSHSAPSSSRSPGKRQPAPWALDRIDQRGPRLDGSFRTEATGEGVTMYFIDTGIDARHEQFSGRASWGTDVIRSDGKRDCHDETGLGHGTFVAGIAGGRTTGVAKKARIVEVKALECSEGTGGRLNQQQRIAKVVEAADWVTAHAERPAVVNMSLNFRRPAPRLRAAVEGMTRAGLTVVVSAGNHGADACTYPPANVPSVITVAASDQRSKHADDGFVRSNAGECVDLYAPGSRITSALAEGGTSTDEDKIATSWAAPFVTGTVALRLSEHPDATPAEVKEWIIERSTRGAIENPPPGTPNRLLYAGGL
ncbi:S8 family peptidase [Streptomyces sp. NPDC047108]|uniref:S8 family peptidase n=1 Tax=Streptomyces sp. NPDC047108 TaxID=3155025 RepID=UPI0033C9F2A3